MTVSAEVEALRNEMTTSFAALNGKIDGYVAAHASQHAGEQAAFFTHKLELAPIMSQLVGPPSIEARMRAQEDGRLAQATVIRTLRAFLVVTTGGSILSAVGFAFMVWKALNP